MFQADIKFAVVGSQEYPHELLIVDSKFLWNLSTDAYIPKGILVKPIISFSSVDDVAKSFDEYIEIEWGQDDVTFILDEQRFVVDLD